MKQPISRAQRDGEDNGNDPDGRMANAKHRSKLVNLQHAGCYGNNAEHRANRKINLAHDDNQHHAGGHHRDG